MTDDDKAFVKLLREMQENWKAAYLSMASHVFGRAADRIEAQAAEIEKLRASFARGAGPDDPAGCPGDNGDSCCGYHEMCREALGETK